jgi:hypothetical protein
MPKPVLQAMVLADHVYRDAETGKFLIIGTFGNLAVLHTQPDHPFSAPSEQSTNAASQSEESEITGGSRSMSASEFIRAGSPYLYVALTGIHGQVPLRIRCVDLSDLNVVFEGRVDVTAVSPVALAEFSLPLPPLPTKLGNFSLEVLHDGEILGQWRVTVSDQTPPENMETNQ